MATRVPENREKARQRARRWREENPEKNREYHRRWREKHPEKQRERSQRRREENPEWAREASRRWRERHPEEARASEHLRRARKAGATIGDPAEVAAREAEIRESRWCVTCEAEVDDLHVDHIQPLSKGGAHSVENLQGLCARHNLEKGAKILPQINRNKGV